MGSRLRSARRCAAAALLAALLPLGAAGPAAAIPGVLRYPGNGHYYAVVESSSPLSWSAARTAAEALGGQLATLVSIGEDGWVGSNVLREGFAWIGASDATTEGTWRWLSGEAMGHAHWAPGQPDDPDGDRDYLLIRFETGGAWEAVRYEDAAFPVSRFVVEWICDPNSPPPHPPAPAPPSDLQAVALFNGTVLLSWTDNSDSERRFEIERRSDDPVYRPLGVAGRDAPRYQDFAVAPGESYSYRVRAENVCGLSAFTNEATVVAVGNQPSPVPRAPSGLLASATGPRAVDLSWIDQSGEETAFEVSRARDGGAFQFLAMTGADAVSFRDDGVVPAADYRYRLRAVSFSGVSFPVEVRAATPPSLGVTALRGAVRDAPGPGRDSVRFAARWEPMPGVSDGLVDPAAEGVDLRAGDAAGSLAIRVPPGDPGWKGRGDRWRWRSPRGSLVRSRVRLHLARRLVTAAARGGDLVAPASNPVRVTLGLGDDGGADEREWASPRDGVFRLR